MVNDDIQAKINSGEISPGTPDYNKILNTARLTAGSIALLYDFDVDVATQSAEHAVKNNSLENIADHCLNWSNCTRYFANQNAMYRPTTMMNGEWQLIEVQNPNGETLGYTAYNNLTKNTDFVILNHEIHHFMNATPELISNTVALAKFTESNPQALNQMQMSLLNRDLSGYMNAWKNGIKDPYFVSILASSVAGATSANLKNCHYPKNNTKTVSKNRTSFRNA